jgi:hypothetical protein
MLLPALFICLDCRELNLPLTHGQRRHAPIDCPLYATYVRMAHCATRREWDAEREAFRQRYGVRFPKLHEPRKLWLSTQ